MAKASDLASRMRGAASAPVVPDKHLAARAAGAPTTLSKYTILLAEHDNEILDNAVRDGRRVTGRRTLGKSDILRALVAELGDDAALRQAVLGRLE